MKLSISVPEDDIAFIDGYGATHGIHSRSGVVQHAVALLRATELADDYSAAWDEWEVSDDAVLWDGAAADGLAAPLST